MSPSLVYDFTFSEGTPAIGEQVTGNFDKVKTLLNNTKLGTDNIQNDAITAALIADGAVLLNNMGSNSVGESNIVDAAATSRKVKLTNIYEPADSAVTLTGSDQNIPGTTRITVPATTQLAFLCATFDIQLLPQIGGVIVSTAVGSIYIDGVQVGPQAVASINADLDTDNVLSGTHAVRGGYSCGPLVTSLSAASHTIELRAKVTVGDATVNAGHTVLGGLLIAA